MKQEIDCRRLVEVLHEYLRHEVTPEIAEQVRAHIEKCRHCFEHVQFEQNYLGLLEAKVKAQSCPAEVRERILATLRSAARDEGH